MNAEELKRYDAYPLLVEMVYTLGTTLELYGQQGDYNVYHSPVVSHLKAANALLKAIGEKQIQMTGIDPSDPDLEFAWER